MSTNRSSKPTTKNRDDVEFLLKTVEDQTEQITRLQTKFRDVTHAYRSLLEEKKALEITLKALKTTSKTSFLNSKLSEIVNKSKNGSKSDLNATSRTPSVSDLSEIDANSNADSADLNSSNPKLPNLNELNYNEKIDALTSNIQLLIDSKSNMERGFQSERKNLYNEREELKTKVESLRQENEKSSEAYEARIKELRVSLKQSQAEREKLASDLNMNLKVKSAEQENKILSMQEENQSILLNLRNENNAIKLKFKNLTKQFENKCEEVGQCGRELDAERVQHSGELQKKEELLCDLRERLSHTENSSELRIGNLEGKINELCTIISKYESGVSQKTISSYLKSQKSEDLSDSKLAQFEIPTDFDAAIEHLQSFKSQIEAKAKDLNIDFNFNEIWFQNGSRLEQEKKTNFKLTEQIEKLKDENKHLKEEYEKYKIRTNYLIKSAKQQQTSRENVNNNNNNEAELVLKQTINNYKNEIDVLNKRIHLANKDKLDEIKILEDEFEEKMNEMRSEFKIQLERAEHERLKSISDLEKELVKQRERTLRLLAERGEELDVLKNCTNSNVNSKQRNQSGEKFCQVNRSEQDDDEKELMSRLSSPTSRNIHFSQEHAYKEAELNKLRCCRADLEYKLKQTNDEHSIDVERYQAQMGVLKQEIERLNLMMDRQNMNGANLEYVKNVVYNFMTTKDKNVKISMQDALTQILKFSQVEKQRLKSISF